MKTFLRRHGFALALAGGMIAFEVVLTLVLLLGQPVGSQWLGSTLISPADNAIYLAEIREGAALITNPFAVEPHAPRVELIWSTLGLIHRFTSASPLVLLELLRWVATIFLAFALVSVARSVADNEDIARKTSLLLTGGLGLGWALAAILSAMHQWTPAANVIPDLFRPFAVVPALLGSPHIILSLALLIIAAHGIWKSVHDRTRSTWGVIAAVIVLSVLQPFFIPLLLVITVMAWTKKLSRRPAQERTHKPAIIFLLSLVPASSYYGWLLLHDDVFMNNYLQQATTAVPNMWGWIFSLAPTIFAIVWLLVRHDREQRPLAVSRWCLAWLIAALTLFALPVPWRGIFMQGLMIPLILLGLPAWVQWLNRVPKQWTIAVLVVVTAATPLCLLITQYAWMRDDHPPALFSQPTAVFHAWDTLKQRPYAVVVADDLTVGTWTPAWSGATSWIGHPVTTPSFPLKHADWKDLFETDNTVLAQGLLNRAGATHLLFTSRDRAGRMASLLGSDWSPIFQEDNVILLEKR